jgi:undecaprenol kinase
MPRETKAAQIVPDARSLKNRPFRDRFAFALAGIIHTLRSENSFRVHVLATCAVLVALIALRPRPLWWAIILLTVTLVLGAELINTALEHLVDHLHPEQHPRIKLVKDCAAGAVLVFSIGALCVAAAFLFDYFG